MYCSNCGIENPNDNKICQNCGAELGSLKTETEPSQNSDANLNEETFTQTETPLLSLVRKTITSKLFLVAIILLSVSIAATCLSNLMAPLKADAMISVLESSGFFEGIDELGGFFSSEEIRSFLESEDGFGGFEAAASGGLMSLAAPILTAVGFWMLYSSAKKGGQGISSGGVTMIKVIETISLVMAEIAAVALIVACFLIPSFSTGDPTTDAALYIAAIILCSILFIAFAVVTVYYIFVLKALKSCQKLLKGEVATKGLGFVMVCCFIFGIFGISGATVFVLFPLTLVSEVSRSVAYILFGIILSNFKKEIRTFEKPFNQYMPK